MIPSTPDPRGIPAYSFADAARYLGLPRSTVAAWARGTTWRAPDGSSRRFAPVIEVPNPTLPLLSFTNLVELHVLAAIRREHSISLPKVRQALDYIGREFTVPHPLARLELRTDGVDLFLHAFGEVLAVSGAAGQLALAEVVEAYLRRIERDSAGIEARLFPFTWSSRRDGPLHEQPRAVVIDPRVSFGRPILAGTGIPTAVLAERYKAGEPMAALAADYRCDASKIEEAIRCEFMLVA